MKKIFMALSVLAALTLGAVPSQALIGMPDDVPATEFVSGFFMVEVNGDLDTLTVFQHVGVASPLNPNPAPTAATPRRNLHVIIRSISSVHLADFNVPYTNYDVVALSTRDGLLANLSDTQLAAIQWTDPVSGVVYYVGYLEVQRRDATAANANDMIGKIYLVDLPAGRAAATNMPGREWMNPAGGWLPQQYQAATVGTGDAEYAAMAPPPAGNPWEAFSPQALAGSAAREESAVAINVPVVPLAFRMMPRYYLHDANAENKIIIWKSVNTTRVAPITYDWNVRGWLFDTNEYSISKSVLIDHEVNIFQPQQLLPAAWMTTYPVAGWFDIPFPGDANANAYGNTWRAVEFLGWSWQFANSASANVNWSTLYPVARQVIY